MTLPDVTPVILHAFSMRRARVHSILYPISANLTGSRYSQFLISGGPQCIIVANFNKIGQWILMTQLNFRSLFTALHRMQTRSSDENSVCLSVCPSVRPSVTRVNCDKTVERSVQIYVPHERPFSLVFWEEECLVGGDPFYVKFWVNRPWLQRNRRFSTDVCP